MIRNENMTHFIYWTKLKNHGIPFATWDRMVLSYLPSGYQRGRDRRTVPLVGSSVVFGPMGASSNPCIFQRPLGRRLLISDRIEPGLIEDGAENLLSFLKTSFIWRWVHRVHRAITIRKASIIQQAKGRKAGK